MKTITISFEVPADVDFPSEKLALAKSVILDALADTNFAGRFDQDFEGEKEIVTALLHES